MLFFDLIDAAFLITGILLGMIIMEVLNNVGK